MGNKQLCCSCVTLYATNQMWSRMAHRNSLDCPNTVVTYANWIIAMLSLDADKGEAEFSIKKMFLKKKKKKNCFDIWKNNCLLQFFTQLSLMLFQQKIVSVRSCIETKNICLVFFGKNMFVHHSVLHPSAPTVIYLMAVPLQGYNLVQQPCVW